MRQIPYIFCHTNSWNLWNYLFTVDKYLLRTINRTGFLQLCNFLCQAVFVLLTWMDLNHRCSNLLRIQFTFIFMVVYCSISFMFLRNSAPMILLSTFDIIKASIICISYINFRSTYPFQKHLDICSIGYKWTRVFSVQSFA